MPEIDKDFFTLNKPDLKEIDFLIKRILTTQCLKIKESPAFTSYIIKDVKVDFVIDPLSKKENRPKILLENNHYLTVDTIENIVSNKFCTIVSRTEPKDFVDFYFIQNLFPKMNIEKIYSDARIKEGLFDDTPTAAFQIEEGLSFLKKNKQILPNLRKDFNEDDFYKIY